MLQQTTYCLESEIKIYLKDIGAVLGLRKTAKKFREDIEKMIALGNTVILDFKEVESVSSCFIYELIAKLYLNIRRERFITFIKFENINKYLKSIISTSVKNRVEQNK
jgi:hypothetical protein